MLATYSSTKRKSVIFRVFKVTHTFKKREIFNFKKSQKKTLFSKDFQKTFSPIGFFISGGKKSLLKITQFGHGVMVCVILFKFKL